MIVALPIILDSIRVADAELVIVARLQRDLSAMITLDSADADRVSLDEIVNFTKLKLIAIWFIF